VPPTPRYKPDISLSGTRVELDGGKIRNLFNSVAPPYHFVAYSQIKMNYFFGRSSPCRLFWPEIFANLGVNTWTIKSNQCAPAMME
jgi:hypothetical protein